jgi:hypothetical protein
MATPKKPLDSVPGLTPPSRVKPVGSGPTALTSLPALGTPSIGPPFIRLEFGAAAAAVQRNLVFVIMPFERDTDDVYAAIKDECAALQLDAKRVDEQVGSHFVMKRLGSLIESAELIICDLTHERPNVYYELGYAHGVGNNGDNILLIAKAGTRLHFDIGQLGVLLYSSTDDLRGLLSKQLKAILTRIRQKV